jgi:hypothetical protein
MDEFEVCTAMDRRKIFGITGIGQRVEHDNIVIRLRAAPVMHEICTDKACASSDEKPPHV